MFSKKYQVSCHTEATTQCSQTTHILNRENARLFSFTLSRPHFSAPRGNPFPDRKKGQNGVFMFKLDPSGTKMPQKTKQKKNKKKTKKNCFNVARASVVVSLVQRDALSRNYGSGDPRRPRSFCTTRLTECGRNTVFGEEFVVEQTAEVL